MAQRKEARVFVTIWDDDAFRAHSPTAQRMYLYLLSQRDLSYCGVIALRERRWARDAAGLTVDEVLAGVEELAEPFGEGFGEEFGQPLVLVDEDTGELLIRSLIRHDGIWKVPNFLKAARESAEPVQSPSIRAALAEELRRLPLEETDSNLVKSLVGEFIADLEKGAAKGSRNPSAKGSANPSGKGSRNPVSRGSGKGAPKGASRAGDAPEGHETASPAPQDQSGADREEEAGQDADRNPSAKGSGNPSAKGSQGNRGTSTTCTTDSPVPRDPCSPGPQDPGKASSEIASRSSDATTPDEPETEDEPGSEPERADVERLCAHLADRIEGNGSKRPKVNKGWRDSARLLLDRDGRTEQQVHDCIDWCQSDDFWHRNILSMPTLRAKYEQLRLAAKPKAGQRTSNRHVESGAADQLADVFGL